MNYLIVGGSGYLGSHIVHELRRKGHSLTIFDNLSGSIKSCFELPINTVIGDISQFETFYKLDVFGPFDGIFHIAAKKSAPESQKNPELYHLVNEIGTANVLQYCLSRSIPNIVFTSSAAVYGDVKESIPISETLTTTPVNHYGLTKLNCEKMIDKFTRLHGTSAISLRVFNMIGAKNKKYFDKTGENVLPVIARSIERSSIFSIYGGSHPTPDGTCVRDYINVQDVSRAVVLSMKYLQGLRSVSNHEVLNICSGKGISILELLRKIQIVTSLDLNWEFQLKREGDPASVIGDNRRAMELIGWKPEIEFEQSIRESF